MALTACVKTSLYYAWYIAGLELRDWLKKRADIPEYIVHGSWFLQSRGLYRLHVECRCLQHRLYYKKKKSGVMHWSVCPHMLSAKWMTKGTLHITFWSGNNSMHDWIHVTGTPATRAGAHCTGMFVPQCQKNQAHHQKNETIGHCNMQCLAILVMCTSLKTSSPVALHVAQVCVTSVKAALCESCRSGH